MDEKTLRKLAGKYQVPLGVLEKDYALTNLLSVIARFPKLHSMVFKGGTALKKIHFKNFRFSEDLDFTCFNDVSDEFINFINNEIKNLDVSFTIISDLEKRPESTKFKVKYDMFNGQPSSIKVDLSLRGDVQLDHPDKPVLHFYDTFPNEFRIPTMDLEEIMAEKIRALTYTKHPRHLYDIWYLNGQGVKINPNMVRSKIKFIYDVDFDIKLLEDRLSEKEPDWNNDLRPLLPSEPPSFNEISTSMLDVISEAMK